MEPREHIKKRVRAPFLGLLATIAGEGRSRMQIQGEKKSAIKEKI